MRGYDITVCVIAVLVGLGLLFVANLQLDDINQQRVDMNLVVNEPLENAPPSLAFATVAMGAFRGLVVDILWIRADTLKEEGKFFDARQLAEWISTLQPRFASVWEFNAWNMAYNISVAIPASQPEQRWRWVRNGYELLRDKGIPYNPKSISLYREMGRIFQHKIGGISDDVHKYYKIQLAREIGPVVAGLGPDFFEASITCPKTWDEFIADANERSLVSQFQQADPAFTTEGDFVKSYLSLLQDVRRFSPDANEVLMANIKSSALRKLDLFARVYELQHTWKMDVSIMKEVNERFGPVDFNDPNRVTVLDWRHPDVHAIYWATAGLKLAAQEDDRQLTTDELNTDRIIMHSLQNLFRYGKLHFYRFPDPRQSSDDKTSSEQPRYVTDVFLRPDLGMFDRYNDAVLALLDKYKDDPGRLTSLKNGHRNMLKNAVLTFYQERLYGEALRIYKELQTRYPRPEFKVSLAEFARNRFMEEIKEVFGINDAREQITALLTESWYLYAIGSDNEAYGRQELAKQLRDHFLEEFGTEQGNRITMPSMNELYFVSAMDFLNDSRYPLYLRQNFQARLYREQPELYKQFQKRMEQEQSPKSPLKQNPQP